MDAGGPAEGTLAELLHLASVFEGVHEGVVVQDAHGRIAYGNEAGLRALGLPPIGATAEAAPAPEGFWDALDEKGAPLRELPGHQALEGASTPERTVRVRASGEERWLALRAAPLRDATGRVLGAATFLRDVTAERPAVALENARLQREAETARRRLAAQDALTRHLAGSRDLASAARGALAAIGENLGWAMGAFWLAEGEGLRCTEAWRAPHVEAEGFEEETRARRFEAGEGLPGRVLREGRPVWVEDFGADPSFPRVAAARAAGLHAAIGIPVPGPQGTRAVMEFFSREARPPDEELLSLVGTLGIQVGLFLDRVQAEEALTESHARRGAILDASLDCIVSIDGRGRVTEWNVAAERTFGWSREEALGREMAELIVPPDMRDAHRQGLARFQASGEAHVLGRRLELPAMRRDGTVFPAELAIVASPGREGAAYTGFLRDITERKRSEETLRRLVRELEAQRARLDTLVSSVPGVVWEWWASAAPSQRPGFVSEHVRDMLGYDAQEWLAAPDFWLDLVHPEERERVAREARAQMDGGRGGTLLSRWRRKDGAYVWTQSWNSVIRDPQGRPAGLRGVTFDVTALRTAEERLRESEERFRRAFHDAGVGMLITGVDGRIVESNLAFARMLGHTPEEVRGLPFASFTHPDDQEPSARMVERMMRGDASSVAFEKRYAHRDGHAVWTHVASSLVRDAQGRPLHFITQVQDITQRRAAEQAMRESDLRFHLVARATSDIIWDRDLAHGTLWWNENFTGTFGYPSSEIEPGVESWTSRIHPEDAERVTRGLHQAIDGSASTWQDEYRFRRRDGTYADILDRGLIMRDASGRAVRMVGSMMDLTERKRAEAELKHVKRNLERILEFAGEGIYGVDAEGVTTFMNAAGLRATGLKAEEAVGRKLHAILHHTRADGRPYPASECPIYQAAHGGPTTQCTDDVFWRADGTSFPVEYVTAPIREGDKVVGAVTVFKDVTQRRRTEAALRESEARYRLLAEHSKDIITRSDTQGVLHFVTPACRDLLGYEPEEMVGLLARTLVHPDDLEDIARKRARLHAEKSTQTLTARFRRKDGRYAWLEIVARPVLDPATGEIRELVSSWRDVGERKAAEEALRASEERYRFMAENSGDVISRHAPDTTYLWVSPAVQRVLGYAPEELIGRRSTELVHPDDLAVGERARSDVLGTPDATRLTLRYRHKDGRYVWLEAAAQTVRDPRTGEPVEIIAASRDVTDRKKAEDEIRESRERLDIALKAAALGAWDLDLATDTAVRSLRHDQIFGYEEPQAEWGARRFLGHVAPEHRDQVQAAFDEAMRTGRLAFECRIRRADGRDAWILAQGVVIHEGGRPRRMLGVVADVTQRRAADDALRESEERFRSLSASSPIGIFMADTAGNATYTNPSAQAICGFDEAEALGMGWASFVHPEDRERVAAGWRAYATSGRPYDEEMRWLHKDGTVRWSHVRAAPVLDDRGAHVGHVGTVEDVTERRRVQQALEKERALLTSILQRMPAGVIVAEAPSGRLVMANDEVNRILGHEFIAAQGIEQYAQYSALDPQGRPVALERYPLVRSLTTGEVVAGEEMHYRASGGAIIPILVNSAPVRDAEGRIIAGVVTFIDITERKRIEEEIQRRAEELARLSDELRYQRDLNQTITDNAGSALFMMDERGHPIFMNPAACEMTGYAGVEEVGGRPLHEAIHFLKPDGSPYPMEECPIDRANAQILRLKDQRETFCRKDGALFPVEYNVAPVTRGGVQRGAVLEVRDITAKERAERELRERAEALARLAEQLERSNRELDQFAYVTSHDLKAPLRGIANLSRWIEEDLGERVTPEARSHLDLLRGRVNRMEALIDAILEYSRVGRRKGKVEPVDARRLVDEVVDLLAPPPGVQVRLPATMPVLQTERARLQQVLMNLIGNAIKHHPRREACVVTLGVEDAGDQWRFIVADNGQGIPRRFHDRVFAIFQTLEARDKVEGTGIGLAIVKKVVESKGGRVELESDEGQGAVFRFTWPKEETGGD